MPPHDNVPYDGHAPDGPNDDRSPADPCGDLFAPRTPHHGGPTGDPLAWPGPNQPDPHGGRARLLARSAGAVPPHQAEVYLGARPPRQSGLSGRDAVRLYHRERARSRGDEALTPGADLLVALLPLARPVDGTWSLVPGSFATTSAEVLYSPSYSPVEKYVWTYLFNHRCYDTWRRTGRAVVDSVRLDDLAACAGVSGATASRAVAALAAKGRLTRRLRGQGRPAVYALTPVESGASVK